MCVWHVVAVPQQDWTRSSGKCGWPDDIFILSILVYPKLFSILAPLNIDI
jgi:hypothetical protein